MSGPILALRAAIRSACMADSALSALMGGDAQIHDEPPRAARPVYAVFGGGTARDWSTSTDRGHEQQLSLTVWAKPGSAASALRVADRISALLDEAELVLAGHRLVRLSVTRTDSERDSRSGLTRVTLRLRATTEVAA